MRLSELGDFHELHGIAAAAARRKGSGDAAADIASAVVVAAWERGEEFNDLENAKAWLQKVAKQRAVDHLRHEKVVEANYGEDVAGTFTSDLVAREKLRSLVDALPAKYHDVIWLTYRDGYSAREVGERLGYGEGTVHKMLSEARARLRPEITDPRLGRGGAAAG